MYRSSRKIINLPNFFLGVFGIIMPFFFFVNYLSDVNIFALVKNIKSFGPFFQLLAISSKLPKNIIKIRHVFLGV